MNVFNIRRADPDTLSQDPLGTVVGTVYQLAKYDRDLLEIICGQNPPWFPDGFPLGLRLPAIFL